MEDGIVGRGLVEGQQRWVVAVGGAGRADSEAVAVGGGGERLRDSWPGTVGWPKANILPFLGHTGRLK